MAERDWQADWDWVNSPDVCITERMQELANYWLLRVREVEAQAAVMREALEQAGEALLDPAYYDTIPDWIANALSVTAGRELLERARELEKENRRLKVYEEGQFWLKVREGAEKLAEENRLLRELVRDIASAVPTFDDERLGYVELQVLRLWFKEAREILGEPVTVEEDDGYPD